MAEVSPVKLPSDECYWTLLISRHWFRYWLGAIMQQAITWNNAGQVYWRINVSLGLSDVIWWHRSGSTLAQGMAHCLAAPSHYLNHYWLIINGLNVEFTWEQFPGILLMKSVSKMSLKITSSKLKLVLHLPGVNESSNGKFFLLWS